MSDRTARIVIAFLAVFVLVQLVLVARLWQRSRDATIEVRATNAGVPLESSEVRVWVHAAGDGEAIVAEGAVGEELAVPPGTYDLRVSDMRVRHANVAWARDVGVDAGAHAVREVALSVGEMQIDAEDGAAETEPGTITVHVFRRGDHDAVVTSMPPDTPVRLAAGRYDVRAVLTVSSEERSVEWLEDVAVEAGRRTVEKVFFRRGSLLVEAYNAGLRLPPGAVTLRVVRAGDEQEEEVERGTADTPLGLPAGGYDVEATFVGSDDEPARWIRGVVIAERETSVQRVDFASGTATLRARAGDAALGPFDVYAYFYRAGDHRQPVAYVPANQPVILAAGRYDVRVSYYRANHQPDAWRYDLAIEPGRVLDETVAFDAGRVMIRAFDREGRELVGDDVFLYVHAAGEHARPIAIARAGELLVLGAGVYDLRAVDTRAPGRDAWILRLAVAPGALVEKSVDFP